MNALAAVRSRPEQAGISNLGIAAEVLATWQVQPGALMVLGRSRASVPVSGMAQMHRMPGIRGVFRCLSWTVGERGAPLFAAAIRFADRAELPRGALVALRGAAHETLTLSLPDGPAEDAAFGVMAARLAGPSGAAVAGFLLDTLRKPSMSRDEPDLPGIAAMLRAFLTHAAPQDGCIEIMAMLPDACLLLQGWGAPVHGAVQVILAGTAVTCVAAQAGGFARSDTAAPATGVMLSLPPQAPGALAGLEQVFILDEHGLHARTFVEHRLLDPVASVGHTRHMLPQLRGPAPMLLLLQEATRPRYDGRDTLSSGAHPVRAAVDVAAAAPGVGAYLSGWMFDPRRIVTALHLCNAAGPVARLDTAWNRVPRPDVSEAFRDEPGFPPPPDPDAGFAVFVPDPAGVDRTLHLQFDFADGERAFFPIHADDPGAVAFRTRLLASVDLYKPSGLPIVERHIAPLLARVRPEENKPARVLMAGPLDRPDAIVVPLAVPGLPRAFLSGFLHDAPAPEEQLVLVCGPEWDQAGLDTLRELVRFHALPATILVSAQTACALSAISAAISATSARSILVAAPGICGRTPGWRQALRRAALASGMAYVCPTLLYEDWSIRFAGTTLLKFQETAPFTHAHAALAGMPASGVQEGGERPAHLGSLECCLLLPAALPALSGTGALATQPGRELAFFLRLRAAGLEGAWAPAVQVYAPENPVADGAGARVGHLVDGWILRETGMALETESAG